MKVKVMPQIIATFWLYLCLFLIFHTKFFFNQNCKYLGNGEQNVGAKEKKNELKKIVLTKCIGSEKNGNIF